MYWQENQVLQFLLLYYMAVRKLGTVRMFDTKSKITLFLIQKLELPLKNKIKQWFLQSLDYSINFFYCLELSWVYILILSEGKIRHCIHTGGVGMLWRRRRESLKEKNAVEIRVVANRMQSLPNSIARCGIPYARGCIALTVTMSSNCIFAVHKFI